MVGGAAARPTAEQVNGRSVLAAAQAPAPWAVAGAEVAALAGSDPIRGLGVDEAAERLGRQRLGYRRYREAYE